MRQPATPPSPAPDLSDLRARLNAAVALQLRPASQVGVTALGLLPDDARLWLMPGTDDIDWTLGDDIAIHHLPALKPFELQGLRALLDAARETSFARLNDRHHQPAPGAAVVPRPHAPRG